MRMSNSGIFVCVIYSLKIRCRLIHAKQLNLVGYPYIIITKILRVNKAKDAKKPADAHMKTERDGKV